MAHAATNVATNAAINAGMHAYFVAGHGSEIFCTQSAKNKNKNNKCQWTVPKGCTIVIAAHPGTTLDNEVYKGLYNKLIALTPDEIINPDKTNLFEKLGTTVMIYREGDKINSQHLYTFVDIMDKDKTGLYYQNVTGLLSINALKQEYDAINQSKQKYKPSDVMQLEHIASASTEQLNDMQKEKIIIEIANGYRYSFYPTAEDIYNYLVSIAYGCPPTMNYKFYLLTQLEKYSYLTVTQNQLCTLHKGVYYNFICRDPKFINANTGNLSRPSAPLYNKQYNQNPNGTLTYPELFGHAVPAYTSVQSLTPLRRKIIKQKLEEMLQRRSVANAQKYATKSAAKYEDLFTTPTKLRKPNNNTRKNSVPYSNTPPRKPRKPLSLTP